MAEPHHEAEGIGVSLSSGSMTGLGRETVGSLLAAAREAMGSSLEEIAHETRVPLRHLLALENDRHDALPALPYAIGFVKAFARTVKLDPETMATRFKSETQLTPHVPTAMKDEPMDERRMPSRQLVLASVAVIVALVVAIGLYGAGAFDPEIPVVAQAPATEAPQMVDPAAATIDSAPLAGPGAALPAPAVSPATAMAMPPLAGEVVLTAREDVWVKIYDRDTRAVARMGIMTPGERFVVPAGQDTLLLRTGKAGALTITVGGRALPALGGPVETIDRVGLNAASLAARFTPAQPAPAQAPTTPVQTPTGA
ncbi:RodZ domain-containing protein [Sandarakinorhabdus sp.]|uniref:helix-turn-helix domain-containing protein n=1 Tax=Sandarakinorhabdus sp. TaxID=1916663 RepID=UPI00286E7595|nr:RodZ domain-containing protein [Sandarakinorhabdus sp.]